jgi:hypothetical protein
VALALEGAFYPTNFDQVILEINDVTLAVYWHDTDAEQVTMELLSIVYRLSGF